MRSYSFTQEGQSIAQSSGLDALAQRLIKTDAQGDLVDDFFSHFDLEPEDVGRYVDPAWAWLREDEKTAFMRGYTSPLEKDWRYIGPAPTDALFGSPSIAKLRTADFQDSMVLSGTVGMQHLNRRASCKLLSRNGYDQYGFRNIVDSLAFAGAYIVSLAAQHQRDKTRDDYPAIKYVSNNIVSHVSVGADFNGDFEMAETKTLDAESIAPNGQQVAYSPETETVVAGYHSIEPALTSAMLGHVILAEGTSKIPELIGEFGDKLTEMGQPADPKTILFANYGDRRNQDEIGYIRYLFSEGIKYDLVDGYQFHTSGHPFRKHTQFFIEGTASGLRIGNRPIGTDYTLEHHIDIPRSQFANFFKLLVKQADDAMGRTGRTGHLELVREAYRLSQS